MFAWRFDLWFRRLPRSPQDEGTVHLVVIRPGETGDGARETPESIELSPERGIHGDKWAASEHRRPGNQVSLMNVHVLRGVAGGDEARMPLAGDNLVVDLDLSEANLPVGTRLEIGTAVLEISPEPHRPCRSFHDRFGVSAAKKVARGNQIGLRGRGVLALVVGAGSIRVGDPIHVVRS